jgi:hypothetical protein
MVSDSTEGNSSKFDSAQLLIFNRYWDIRMDATQYSFVDYAISRGYSVFFYDRLGTGLSTKFVLPPWFFF